MTPAELRTYIYNISLLEEVSAEDTRLNSYLEIAYNDLTSLIDWPWMIDEAQSLELTVANEGRVTLPSGFVKVISVWIPNVAEQLKGMSIAEAVAEFAGEGDTGRPEAYYVTGTDIVCLPIPDVTYNAKWSYYAVPAWDPSTTNEPPFDSRFHHGLAEFALAKVWERDEDFERSRQYYDLYLATVGKMVATFQDQTTSKPLIYGLDKRSRTRYNPIEIYTP